jgi:hypothetical protein
MTVDIPSQYVASVTSSWNAYQYALNFGSASLQATALAVLMLWLNRCNTALGHPTVAKPYPEPPVAPAVVEVDGVLKLEYPA